MCSVCVCMFGDDVCVVCECVYVCVLCVWCVVPAMTSLHRTVTVRQKGPSPPHVALVMVFITAMQSKLTHLISNQSGHLDVPPTGLLSYSEFPHVSEDVPSLLVSLMGKDGVIKGESPRQMTKTSQKGQENMGRPQPQLSSHRKSARLPDTIHRMMKSTSSLQDTQVTSSAHPGHETSNSWIRHLIWWHR